MAGKRTEMSKIKQILLLHKDGMSNRKIGERLGLYKETVNKYVNAAKSDSKSIEELIKMEEPELQHRFSAGNAAYSDKRFDALQEDLEYYVRELERRHVTMLLLWEEYRQKHPDGYGYTQFCYEAEPLFKHCVSGRSSRCQCIQCQNLLAQACGSRPYCSIWG